MLAEDAPILRVLSVAAKLEVFNGQFPNLFMVNPNNALSEV